VNYLGTDGQRFGDQVRLTGRRRRAVGPELDEKLEGVAALISRRNTSYGLTWTRSSGSVTP